jgi:hypothetical protein
MSLQIEPHADVHQAFHHKRFGSGHEAKALVKPEFRILRLDIDVADMGEVLAHNADGRLHYQHAIALAALGGYDAPYARTLHLRASGADATHGQNLFTARKPYMNGRLVVAIQVLVHAILLHHKHLGADAQKFVQFSDRKLAESLDVQLATCGQRTMQRGDIRVRHAFVFFSG